MSLLRTRRAAVLSLVAAVLLVLAAVLAAGGCGVDKESVTTTTASGARMSPTTAAPATTVPGAASAGSDEGTPPAHSSAESIDPTVAGTLGALEAVAGQKIISDVQLEIEVERGKFQTVFDQAMMLAGRYGGYLLSSNSYSTAGNEGEDDGMRSGTVTIRVPVGSFAAAVSDATKLGILKKQTLSTQDVTEEYVDLEARIKNKEAHVDSLLSLLGKAVTVDDILRVQSVLSSAQQELEQLKGRLRFLEEHTSFATITMTIYEQGTEPLAATSWGVGSAFKDALHYLVRVFNGIIRALGVLVPTLIVLAIIGCIVYLVVRAVHRRNARREEARR